MHDLMVLFMLEVRCRSALLCRVKLMTRQISYKCSDTASLSTLRLKIDFFSLVSVWGVNLREYAFSDVVDVVNFND